MSEFAHFFSVYAAWIAVPSLAIIGILFYWKQKTKESLILAIGLVLLAVGALIQIFSPFRRITVDEAGKVLSSLKVPLSWYTGSIIISIGFIITVVGFALVTWKVKK